MATMSGPGPAATTPARDLILCGNGTVLHFPLDRDDVRRQLQTSLAKGEFEILAHDLKRDLLALKSCGVEAGGSGFDVMIASYLIEATATHGLGEIASEVLGARIQGFRETPEATAAGVGLLPRLREELSARLRELDLERLFREVEMPLAALLARMEHRGVLLDAHKLAAMGREFEGRLGALMAEVYALAGGEFNVNSPPQLREVLFERLGLPTKGVRRGKTGYSTDVDVLTRLAPLHPLPARILEYRVLAKLKSTYIDALPAAINPATGRLHTTFNQTVAATGRLSSSDPNLQNIPIRGEHGRRIREAFVAPEGSILMGADYSQIELRVLAHFSGDPALLDAFRAEQDIHARTAAEVFGVLPGTVTADMRRAAKVINFGIIYGMGPQRLAQELGIPFTQAQQYIASYFERYTGVRAYMQSIAAEARRTGYVTTILGRRRQVGDLRGTDRAAAQAAERAATNTPIQGSAADIIKVAMLAVARRLERQGLQAALILQVHDELLLEVPEKERDAVAQVVREEMEGAMDLKVPLRVDVAWGRSWADAH
jgi:DNA polymerase-1